MSKILLNRGPKANLPVLGVGEPAWTTDTKELFIGSAEGNIQISSASGVSVKEYKFDGEFSGNQSSLDIIANLPIYKYGDSVALFVGGLYKTEGVNYEIVNGVIQKLDDGTGTTWPDEYTYDVRVFKNVDDPGDDAWIDGGTF